MEPNTTIHPGAVALAKALMFFGLAGLVLWLMPWSADLLFWGFVLPLLVVFAIASSLGLGGKAVIDFYNATVGVGNMAAFKAAIEEALVAERKPAA